jgi:hypothetical protein
MATKHETVANAIVGRALLDGRDGLPACWAGKQVLVIEHGVGCRPV